MKGVEKVFKIVQSLCPADEYGEATFENSKVKELINHRYFCSLIVGRGNEIFFEKYADDFTQDQPQTIMSITKMFLNLFIGELIIIL